MFPKETNILIVDDMMTMRKLVKKSLTELGFTKITEAPDGAQAWDKVNLMASGGTPFQLIISDWNMPNVTGLELLKKVRAMPKVAATPFLLLTAESEKSQVVEAIQARVSGYVIKPFTTQNLDEKLKGVWAALQPKKVA